MKLLSLFLASSSFAQDDASDKWVGYDYGSYYGDTGLAGKFIYEDQDGSIPSGRIGNGLHCHYCHGRLRMGSAEGTGNNAWMDCMTATGHGQVECDGDERSCLTEERRRYDITVEVKAGCKNPEACMYQWRRNERYMPMFHLFGDQTDSANPMFFDDECIDYVGGQNSKHLSQRAQWESTCRHCCAAVAGSSCNVTGGPIFTHCGGSATCPAAADSTTHFGMYSIINIPGFMNLLLANNRVHPGEGRNSLPSDKFISRTDSNGNVLREQADRLSTEDVDFHNNRANLAGTNGAFGSR